MSTIDSIPLVEWRDTIRRSVEETVNDALHQFVGEPEPPGLADRPWGAFIPLMCAQNTLRVGMVATPDGCARIARAFVGEDGAGELPATDVADAMCELLNLVAGSVQREVADKVKVRIGLPIFVRGALQLAGEIEMAEQSMKVGEVPVVVTVFRYHRE